MGRAYSSDLRERVVKAVAAGASCRSAALRFGVAPSSAVKWVARWRERGDVSPGSSRGRKRSPLHGHRDWLLALNRAEPDLTLIEVRDRLASELGLVTAEASVWRFFAREGIRFKKNAAAIRARAARRGAQAGELEAVSGPDRG
jgi:putative transposase